MYKMSLRDDTPKAWRQSNLYKILSLILACLFLVNDLSWAAPQVPTPQQATLAPQSRFTLFDIKNEIDFKCRAKLNLAADTLGKLFMAPNLPDDVIIRRTINRLNSELFPDQSVVIDETWRSRKVAGKDYKYVTFKFANDGKMIDLFFIKDYENIPHEELAKFGIKTPDDRRNLESADIPGLKGQWFCKRRDSADDTRMVSYVNRPKGLPGSTDSGSNSGVRQYLRPSEVEGGSKSPDRSVAGRADETSRQEVDPKYPSGNTYAVRMEETYDDRTGPSDFERRAGVFALAPVLDFAAGSILSVVSMAVFVLINDVMSGLLKSEKFCRALINNHPLAYRILDTIFQGRFFPASYSRWAVKIILRLTDSISSAVSVPSNTPIQTRKIETTFLRKVLPPDCFKKFEDFIGPIPASDRDRMVEVFEEIYRRFRETSRPDENDLAYEPDFYNLLRESHDKLYNYDMDLGQEYETKIASEQLIAFLNAQYLHQRIRHLFILSEKDSYGFRYVLAKMMVLDVFEQEKYLDYKIEKAERWQDVVTRGTYNYQVAYINAAGAELQYKFLMYMPLLDEDMRAPTHELIDTITPLLLSGGVTFKKMHPHFVQTNQAGGYTFSLYLDNSNEEERNQPLLENIPYSLVRNPGEREVLAKTLSEMIEKNFRQIEYPCGSATLYMEGASAIRFIDTGDDVELAGVVHILFAAIDLRDNFCAARPAGSVRACLTTEKAHLVVQFYEKGSGGMIRLSERPFAISVYNRASGKFDGVRYINLPHGPGADIGPLGNGGPLDGNRYYKKPAKPGALKPSDQPLPDMNDAFAPAQARVSETDTPGKIVFEFDFNGDPEEDFTKLAPTHATQPAPVAAGIALVSRSYLPELEKAVEDSVLTMELARETYKKMLDISRPYEALFKSVSEGDVIPKDILKLNNAVGKINGELEMFFKANQNREGIDAIRAFAIDGLAQNFTFLKIMLCRIKNGAVLNDKDREMVKSSLLQYEGRLEIWRRITEGEIVSSDRQRQRPTRNDDGFASAVAEAGRIHEENKKYRPKGLGKTKTILCHIAAEEIFPYIQRDMLRALLQQEMEKDAKCVEKVALLPVCGSSDFVDEVKRLIDRKRADYATEYPGYEVEFDIACPSTEIVNRVLDSGLGIRALAFDPCQNDVQPEGIILALRVRRLDDIGRLKAIFEFLARRPLSMKEQSRADINNFVRSVPFKLPSAKLLDNDKRRFNKMASDNVMSAA